jgi:nitroreductase
MLDIHSTIEKAIHRSQPCQRNWDLSQKIPNKDIDLILTALTQCPSKQNVAHYKIHAITNRDIIEKIHTHTDGFSISINPYKTITNTQVLANLLIVIEHFPVVQDDPVLNIENFAFTNGDRSEKVLWAVNRDCQQAVGVAAGYANLTASMLGYATGFCSCFSSDPIREILSASNEILLMIGIGYKNPTLPRRVSHIKHNFIYPSSLKQPIEIKLHN